MDLSAACQGVSMNWEFVDKFGSGHGCQTLADKNVRSPPGVSRKVAGVLPAHWCNDGFGYAEATIARAPAHVPAFARCAAACL